MMRYERIYNGDNGLPVAQIVTPLKANAQWMTRYFVLQAVLFMHWTSTPEIYYWETQVFNPDESSLLAYWDGYVYHPHYGKLYILNGETGEIVHTMRGPDEAYTYQVSAGAGKIFVQSSQHLYAFSPYDPEKDND